MNWYRDYHDEWKEIIETVSRECGRDELMIEKDTIQSLFLLELSKISLPFVFKGGTSLSKAYSLILNLFNFASSSQCKLLYNV